ncbi:MAG TPA: nucleoside hydrolase [Trebonia sp.]|nr:nucleoside hydrolase [Trebonia sp.]
MSTRIILDCDPGIDDALAIAFAHGHPEIELVGLTTVAGNVGLPKTTRNGLAVADFVGAGLVPVTAGCAGPLLRQARDARDVHGETGLGGAVIPDSARKPRAGHAVDFILDEVCAAPGEITLIATGPLTNIALAVRKDPRLVRCVREFVIMGGSAGRGNVTPAAEFNIWADPEAASVVFGAGWTVRMIGLDVTLQALASASIRERMAALGPLASALLLPALAQYHEENRDPAVHDVCAVASVAVPDLFLYTPARVQVETTGQLTYGMTVTDFSPSPLHNAQVATSVDVDRFWDVVLAAYTRVAAALPRPA